MSISSKPIAALCAVLLGFGATGCSTQDPLGNGSASTGSETTQDHIVIGSQDYYSNEIIAEIYAQTLEEAGFSVDREFRIGQRETYMKELESGKIDLFPEYSGPLLRYWKSDTTETESSAVFTALQVVAPEGLQVLSMANAADQDTYVVTKSFAQQWDLTKLSDLTKVTDPIKIGANSEAESRPYGPAGLKDKIGIQTTFTPIEDGGGPLTVKALLDNTVQMAILYTASPAMASPDLVSLEDDKGVFLPSNIVAVASTQLPEAAVKAINGINDSLDTNTLVELNIKSVQEQQPASVIAKAWREAHKS